MYVGVALIVWTGKVLSNVRFFLLGNCIIRFFLRKQFQTDVPLVFCFCRHNETRPLYRLWWGALYIWNIGSGWGPQTVTRSHVLRQGSQFWRSVSAVRKHVPKIETGIIRLTILGSMWGRQEQIHRGLPARRGNCSRQGINFQKCWATNFGKTKIELYVGQTTQNQNRTHTTIVDSAKSFTSFWHDRVLRLQTSNSRVMTWVGSLGNIPRRT